MNLLDNEWLVGHSVSSRFFKMSTTFDVYLYDYHLNQHFYRLYLYITSEIVGNLKSRRNLSLLFNLLLFLWIAIFDKNPVLKRKQTGILQHYRKTQVGVEFRDRRPYRIHSLTVIASQSEPGRPELEQFRDDIMEAIITPVFRDEAICPDDNTRIFINPGGPFITGGPSVHSGLTGRKNAIDTYGEYSRHSGAALSGKDPLRIDRVGAYAARYAAKNIVAAGIADECEIQIRGRGRNNMAFLHTGRNCVIPVRENLMSPNADVFEDLIWDGFSGFIGLRHQAHFDSQSRLGLSCSYVLYNGFKGP